MLYPEVTRKLEAAARARRRNHIIRGMTPGLQEKPGVLGDACQLPSLGCQLSSHFRGSNAAYQYTRRVKLSSNETFARQHRSFTLPCSRKRKRKK
jgi:hypothetical protein